MGAALKLMPSGSNIRPALENVAFHLSEAVYKLVDLDTRLGRTDHGEENIDGQMIAHAGVDLDDFVPANRDRSAMLGAPEGWCGTGAGPGQESWKCSLVETVRSFK